MIQLASWGRFHPLIQHKLKRNIDQKQKKVPVTPSVIHKFIRVEVRPQRINNSISIWRETTIEKGVATTEKVVEAVPNLAEDMGEAEIKTERPKDTRNLSISSILMVPGQGNTQQHLKLSNNI